MKILRNTVITLTCVLAAGMGAAAADTGKRGYGGMPHYYGHMGMMSPGYGSMMGHGQGWMMGPHQGWMGHGPMMGHGHGHGQGQGHGHGPMMGHGYGHGPMMGPGRPHMWGEGRMDPDQLSDDFLDRVGERIAQRHQTMQEIAAEQDQAARRDLVRKYLKDHQTRRGGNSWSEDADDGDDLSRRGYGYGRMMGQGPGGGMGPGMMGQGPGMMGQGSGMMGPGAGGGMGLGMMDPGQLSDEQLDRLAEQMAENHERMQRLAATRDKAERRDLLREHFESMRELMASMHQDR